MNTENLKALVAYRLEQARESLALLKQKILRSSINRSYYAMFYAVLALLALEKRETSKHGGAISLFDAEFVKKDLFGKEFSRWLHEAFDLRQRSDYTAGARISAKEAELVLEHARVFLKGVEDFLKRKGV